MEYVHSVVMQLSNDISSYPNIRFSSQELMVFNDKLFKWPLEVQIPIMDTLRCLFLHYQSESLFSSLDKGQGLLTHLCSIITH